MHSVSLSFPHYGIIIIKVWAINKRAEDPSSIFPLFPNLSIKIPTKGVKTP